MLLPGMAGSGEDLPNRVVFVAARVAGTDGVSLDVRTRELTDEIFLLARGPRTRPWGTDRGETGWR